MVESKGLESSPLSGQRAVSLGKQNRSMRARIMYSAALILVGILGLRKTGVEV